MQIPFHRCLSLLLIGALATDPCATAWGALARASYTPSYRMAAGFEHDALAARPLTALSRIGPFFSSLSRSLKAYIAGQNQGIRYSQLKVASTNSVEDRNPEVLWLLHQKATEYLSDTLARPISQQAIAAEEFRALSKVLTFLKDPSSIELLLYYPFPKADRVIGAFQDGAGQKRIVVNPLKSRALGRVLETSPEAGLIAAELMVEEILEIFLEDPEMNPWSKETDIDEVWVEAYIFKQKSNLWRLRRLMRAEEAPHISVLRPAFETLYDKTWLPAYFSMMEKLLEGPGLALSQAAEPRQHTLWEDVFLPVLALNYSAEFLAPPIRGLQESWKWAAQKIASHSGLPPAPTNPRKNNQRPGWRYSQGTGAAAQPPTNGELVLQTAEQAAESLYANRTLPNSEPILLHVKKTAETYRTYCRMNGLEPDPYVLAASYLFHLSKKERVHALHGIKKADVHKTEKIMARLQDGFGIAYDPPRNVSDIQPNAPAYQMGRYGKSLVSAEELLWVLAKKMVILESGEVSEEAKRLLYCEFRIVLGYFMGHLGAREFGNHLRNQALQAARPARYRRLRRVFELIVGLTRVQANQHEDRVAREIEEKLQPLGILRAEGISKTEAAMQRKLLARKETYKKFKQFEDYLRFRVILRKPQDLGQILKAVGEVSIFTGELTKKGVPEAKKLPGYNAYHVTFLGLVNGALQPHEIQIFMTEEEYENYENGWPDGWWAYAIGQETGAKPDYIPYDSKPNDLAGNFERFKLANEPYTFFSISPSQEGDLRLIPASIPNAFGMSGNAVDAAVINGELNENTDGIIVYRRTYDPTAGEETGWKRDNRRSEGLAYVIQDGEVIGPTEGHHSIMDNPVLLREIERTTSTLPGLVIINGWLRHPFSEIRSNGARNILARLRADIGLVPHGNGDLPAFYVSRVLGPLAIKLAFPSADHLIAGMGLEATLDNYIPNQQEELWRHIRAATRAYGAHQLDETKETWITPETRRQLDDAARAHRVDLRSADSVALALGSGFRSWEDMEAAIAKAETPNGATSRRPSEPIKKPGDIEFLAQLEQRGDVYELDVTVENDQPGITAALLSVLTREGFYLVAGTRSKLRERGAFIHFVLKNNRKTVDAAAVVETIQERLSVRRTEPLTGGHTFRASVYLHSNVTAQTAFIQSLKAAFPTSNMPLCALDEDGWLELILQIPDSSKNTHTAERLHAWFQMAQDRLRMNGEPLIYAYEISDNSISPATAAELLKLLNKAKPAPITKRVQKLVADLLSSPMPAGEVDPAQVALFDRAIQLAQRLHEGEVRASGEPYVDHPLSIAILSIEQGETDFVKLLTALFHDTLENIPTLLFRESHPGKTVPSLDDPEMLEFSRRVAGQIADQFPEIQHQLLKDIRRMTYSKTRGTLSEHTFQVIAANLNNLKLRDDTANLVNIFDIDAQKYPNLNPSRQIAKRLRYGLPKVMDPDHIRPDVDNATRKGFLDVLIRQTLRLKEFRLDFTQSGELQTAATKEFYTTLGQFLDYMDRNPELWPWEITDTRIGLFRERLRTVRINLAHYLEQRASAQIPPHSVDTPAKLPFVLPFIGSIDGASSLHLPYVMPVVVIASAAFFIVFLIKTFFPTFGQTTRTFIQRSA